MESILTGEGRRETPGKKGGISVGLPARKIQAEPETEQTGKELIHQLTDMLAVKPTLVAALLEVTERTLGNWAEEPIRDLAEKGKGARLVRLHEFVSSMWKNGVRKNLILNALREPFNPEDENSCSPLYYIVHEPESALLPEMLSRLIKEYV